MPLPDVAEVTQIDLFAEVIDVRSPAEFADDHVPRACNFPVLNDAERAEVGTLNAHQSPFAARRRGAVLTARNIAAHIESEFHSRTPDWHPLIYCWRGGQRSRSMALVLREVGWHASVLRGGYKAFRREVIEQLAVLPRSLRFIVVCGETGTGKSRLLALLASRGAQVVDLEALACHRGSLLGDMPDQPQPSQRSFETRLCGVLRDFTPDVPVFVESESRKVGNLQLPEGLVAAMRASPCVRLAAPLRARVSRLLQEYAQLVEQPAIVAERIGCFKGLYSSEQVERWKAQIRQRETTTFVTDILERHYDPAYRRSMVSNFPGLESATTVELQALDDETLDRAAEELFLSRGRPAL